MEFIENIDSATLKDWIELDEVLLLDVREISEYEQAHIEGSFLIPVGRLSSHSIPENPDKRIVFYCRSGGRSYHACQVGASAYPGRSFYNLGGGILEWIQCGYPVKSMIEE